MLAGGLGLWSSFGLAQTTGDAASRETESLQEESEEAHGAEPSEKSSDAEGSTEESAGAARAEEEAAPQAEEAALPPLDPDAQEFPHVRPRDEPVAPSRRLELGALVGLVSRPSDSDAIRYQPGYTFGGFARVELMPWLGVRLHYRQERIAVDVDPGAFDFEGQNYSFDWHQPALEVVSIGGRFEPTWVIHPQFRAFAVLGISWTRFDAKMPEAPGFLLQGKRSATEVNFPLGLGASVEILPNWLSASLSLTYGFIMDAHGAAYQPLQAIVDGQMVYLAPLPAPRGVLDAIFTIGVIL